MLQIVTHRGLHCTAFDDTHGRIIVMRAGGGLYTLGGSQKGRDDFLLFIYSFFPLCSVNCGLGVSEKVTPRLRKGPLFYFSSYPPEAPFIASPVMYNLHIVRIQSATGLLELCAAEKKFRESVRIMRVT